MRYADKCEHVDRRYYALGLCRACHTKYWNNRPDRLAARVARATAWNKTHPEERKISKHRHIMKARYGLTPYQYEILMLSQGGACGICGLQSDEEGKLHVDHDHRTGTVRGFLCGNCNLGLGMIREGNILNAIDYVVGNNGR